MPITTAEMAMEMETVQRALAEGASMLSGLDAADRARQLGSEVRYSPLRTLFQNAEKAAERIVEALNQLDSTPGGPPSRDGGPL